MSAYMVRWDAKYKRPTLDGKVQNPHTGEIEDIESKSTWAGPPCVDTIWINMRGGSDFKIVRASFNATVDEVYLEVANHIRDKEYGIVSVSASEYSFTIVCMTEKSMAQFHEALSRMQNALARSPGVPPGAEGPVESGK